MPEAAKKELNGNGVHIYATDNGRLYIKPSELFSGEKGIELLKQLMDTDIYKKIKENEESQKTESSNP